MKRLLFVSVFVVSCLLLVVSQTGCGQVSSSSAAISTTVTLSGAAAASSADLAKLGATTLGIETLEEKKIRINSLKAKGFDTGSINALDLKPLGSSNAAIGLYIVNADGTYTLIKEGVVNADGTYLITYEAYDPSKAYVIRITKTSSTTGKDLTLETFIDTKASTASATARIESLTSSPQTTLLVKMILDKVVEEVGSAAIDADIVKLINSLVIDKINYLVTAEGLSITNVKGTSESENVSLKNAASQGFTDSIIQKAIYAIKFKAGAAKGATSLADAKKVLKEVFTYITGSPTGIPEAIINSFAQSYKDGVTKTLDQVVSAANKSISPTSTIYTAANIKTALTSKISGTYTSTSITGLAPSFEIKEQNPVVQAFFPASEWLNKSIDGNTTFNIPQLVILVEILQSIAMDNGVPPNPSAAAYHLGLMTGIADEFTVMHSELRVESYEDWMSFHPTTEADRPVVYAILTSFLEVGNLVNPNADATGLTAKLFYQKANGTQTSQTYKKLSATFGPKSISSQHIMSAKEKSIRSQGGGAPSSFALFQIMPWGQTSEEAIKITDYLKGSNATIEVYDNNGTKIISRTVTITSVDLKSASIQFKTPYPDVFSENNAFMSVFQTGSKPKCEWTFGTAGTTTIDFGSLTSAYAVEIRSVIWQTDPSNPGNSFPFSDFSSPAIYSSWNKQDFIKGAEGETVSLTVPAALDAGYYTIQGAVIGVDSNGWPIVQGPWRSTVFKVGGASSIQSKVVTIEGTVTPPTTIEDGKSVKVGLFYMNQNTNFFNTDVAPVKVSSPSSNIYSMTLSFSELIAKGNGGYDTIAWVDDGDGILEGTSDERPYFPSKHLGYWNGTLNAMDQNFQPLGPVTSTQNNTGYNVDMGQQFWGP